MNKNTESDESDKIFEAGIIQPEYVMTKKYVTKRTIKNFFRDADRRQIRTGQIKSLLNSLKNDEHIGNPLVLEKKNGGFSVIDGNHRIDAIEKWLVNGGKGIWMWCAIYDELTPQQRRNVYTTWNIAIRQSTDDFICSHKDDIPMYPRIHTELDCNVYGNHNHMKFKHLVGGYFSAINPSPTFSGGFMGSPMEFVEKCKNDIGNKDVDLMKEFWSIIKEAFFISSTTDFRSKYSYFSKTSPFYSMYRLWWVNRNRFSRREIINRLRKTSVEHEIQDYAPRGGRKSCQECYDALIKAINIGYPDADRQFQTNL